MKLTRNLFTIADLNEWFGKKTLVINQNYQRGRGLWPLNARSYFIDSILNGFPFPKITIRQTVDLKTKKSIREIIDGQQRMTAIRDFINDKLILSKVSENYKGRSFSNIDKDIQQNFLSYEVAVDTVIAASEEEVLEIFRRMNSYTLPLNEAERRHATYQGEFKWYVKDMIKLCTPLFEKWEILTVRQISRMQDADLITELCQIITKGIITRNKTNLDGVYKENEKEFSDRNEVDEKLTTITNYIRSEMAPLGESRMLKGYSFYSLFSALLYNRWGVPNISSEDTDGIEPIGKFTSNNNKAIQNILELFYALDQKDDAGQYGDFVKASMRTTHSISNRKTRLKWMVAALQDELEILIR